MTALSPRSPQPRQSRASRPCEEWSASPTGDFARAVQHRTGTTNRLERGVQLVVELVGGCDHAGVTIADRCSVETVAATDDHARRGDALQYALDEGPCLDAVRYQHTVISQDLSADRRWPQWGPRVRRDVGVRSMMSLLLYTHRDTFGALNLYADRVQAWDDHGIALGHALADQLATALADAREIEDRTQAMASRTTIGQAQGIVMERLAIDADGAFAYLRRVSQDTNRKLVEVAEELVRTRRLPDPRALHAPRRR